VHDEAQVVKEELTLNGEQTVAYAKVKSAEEPQVNQ